MGAGMLDRLSELIQRSKTQGGVGAVTGCNIVWPSKSAEERVVDLAQVTKFAIEDVELIVDGDTLRIRPKTVAAAVQETPVAEVVTPSDDLSAKLDAASDGDSMVIAEGTHKIAGGQDEDETDSSE